MLLASVMTRPDVAHGTDVRTPVVGVHRGGSAFMRRVLGAFVAMDASFKVLIVPAYLDLTGARTARGGSRLALCLEVAALVVSAWLLVSVALTGSVARWLVTAARGTPSDQE